MRRPSVRFIFGTLAGRRHLRCQVPRGTFGTSRWQLFDKTTPIDGVPGRGSRQVLARLCRLGHGSKSSAIWGTPVVMPTSSRRQPLTPKLTTNGLAKTCPPAPEIGAALISPAAPRHRANEGAGYGDQGG